MLATIDNSVKAGSQWAVGMVTDSQLAVGWHGSLGLHHVITLTIAFIADYYYHYLKSLFICVKFIIKFYPQYHILEI